MDPLRFFPIVERELDLQNPMHVGTLDRLAAAAGVRDDVSAGRPGSPAAPEGFERQRERPVPERGRGA